MELFKLLGTIAIDNKEALNNLDSTQKAAYDARVKIADNFNKVGTAFTNAGKKLTILSAAIVAAGVACIKYASDTEESMNKVDVAFGDSADEVKEFAKTTLNSFGIAEGTALDMTALYGDMATSMGLSTSEAAKLSTELVGLAGDLASFKNMSIDEVQTALNGIFTGETESLKRLGIVMTQTNLDAYALSKGFKKTTSQMSQSELVSLRYQYVMEKTKNAQGDFARTSDGTANSLRVTKESVKELASNLGKELLPIAAKVLTKINNFIQKLSKMDSRTKKFIIRIAAVVAAIGPLLLVIGKVSKGISGLIGVYNKLVTSGSKLGTSIAGLMGKFAAAGPVIAIVTAAVAAAAIAAGVLTQAFYDSTPAAVEYRDKMKEVRDHIKDYQTAMEDLQKTREETVDKSVGELNYYGDLKDELGDLIDANGKVKEGYEDRAKFIVNTLNDSLGTEIEMTDGVISNYQELSDKIDQVLQKKKAEIILSAYEEEYKNAIQNRTQVMKDLATQQDEVNRLQDELNVLEQQNVGEDIIAAKRAELKEAQETYNNYKDTYVDCTNIIMNYESMLADSSKGNYSKIVSSQGDLTESTYDTTTITKDELQKQIKIIESYRDQSLKLYKETGNKQYKEDADRYDKQLTQFKKQLKSMESTAKDNSLETVGKSTSAGFLKGFSSNISAIIEKAKEMAHGVRAGIEKTLDIHSPSRVLAQIGEYTTQGFAIGLENELPAVTSAMQKISGAVTDNAIGSIGQPSAYAYTSASGGQNAPYSQFDASNDSLTGLLNKVLTRLDTIADKSDKQIVLEDGTLVGKLDSKLENLQRMKLRGI